jgi:hypothetical protein
MIEDGPLLGAVENPKPGIIRQRLTTLFVRDGMLVEETIERTYSDDGDYIDSVVTAPLVSAGELSQ